MMTKRSSRSGSALMDGLLLPAAILVLAATSAQAGPNCDNNPDHPKCGGGDDGGGDGGGSGEIALVTTFDCPTGASCPSSAWQADSYGPYFDGISNVKSRFNSAGGYVLTMHERQNQIGTRKVAWDLAFAGGPTVTLPNGASFSSTSDLDPEIAHKTIIQVGKFTDFDLRTMSPGETNPNVDMLLDLIVDRGKRNGGASQLMVRYGDAATGQCPAGSSSTGATVTRTDGGSGPRTWTVTTPMTACLYDFEMDYGDQTFGTLTLFLEEQ